MGVTSLLASRVSSLPKRDQFEHTYQGAITKLLIGQDFGIERADLCRKDHQHKEGND